MASDKVVGLILMIASIGIIAYEFWFGLMGAFRLDDDTSIDGYRSILVALAIPLFIGVLGVFIILAWIGWTMMTTPPPEQFNFDEEVDLDTEEAE